MPPPELPPQEAIHIVEKPSTTSIARIRMPLTERWREPKVNTNPISPGNRNAYKIFDSPPRGHCKRPVGAVVVIVRVTAVALDGLPGLKWQVDSLGRFAQVYVNGSAVWLPELIKNEGVLVLPTTRLTAPVV